MSARASNAFVNESTHNGLEKDAVLISDDDAPMATSFKDRALLVSKAEKAVKHSIQLSKEKAKAKRKARQAGVQKIADDILVDDKSFKNTSIDNDEETSTFEYRKSKIKQRSLENIDAEDEFKLADTFDFRKYLPQEILNEDSDNGDNLSGNLDSEEEELADAIMEGGFGEDLDPDVDFVTSNKQYKGKPKKSKNAAENGGSDPNLTDTNTKVRLMKRKMRRRGGRRYRKRFSAAPRVVILSRQDSAAEIRQRADEFVNQRLFGAVDANGVKHFRAPKRMTSEEMRQMAAKLKARKLYLRGL